MANLLQVWNLDVIHIGQKDFILLNKNDNKIKQLFQFHFWGSYMVHVEKHLHFIHDCNKVQQCSWVRSLHKLRLLYVRTTWEIPDEATTLQASDRFTHSNWKPTW